MKGKLSEIIDNIIDTEELKGSNNNKDLGTWNSLTFTNIIKSSKTQVEKKDKNNDKFYMEEDSLDEDLNCHLEKEKSIIDCAESRINDINNDSYNDNDKDNNDSLLYNNKTDPENDKILNENLFKNKGFRSNFDDFLRKNEDTLSQSGISSVSSLSEKPNVFTCIYPRPNTRRYRRAMKNYADFNSINNLSTSIKRDPKDIILNASLNSFKKNLPKIKKKTEEKKGCSQNHKEK